MVGLQRDSVSISRPSSTGADAEGDATNTLTAQTPARGTWGSPRAVDQQVAAQRGTTIDAAIAMAAGVDVRDGDVVTVRGLTYTVVDVIRLRTHARVLIRQVG